jgi:hypothetical protein
MSQEPFDMAGQTHLEHRWGERFRCKALVHLSTGTGTSSTGRVRDISSSGAFFETAVEFPVNAPLDLVMLGNESATHAVNMTATVVRVDRDGIGVEWCNTPACLICSVVGCTVRCAAPGDEG